MKRDVTTRRSSNNKFDWYAWNEFCDKCGAQICDLRWACTEKPDMNESDFCSDCIMELIQDGVLYEEAKRIYKDDKEKSEVNEYDEGTEADCT